MTETILSPIDNSNGTQTTALSSPTNNVPTWMGAVKAKQADIKARLPAEWRIPPHVLGSIDLSLTSTIDLTQSNVVRKCGTMSEHEIEITEKFSAMQLLAKMSRGEMTSLEVTIAFSKRAAIAQQLLSCLTETMFDQAQERARFLDDYLQREGKVYGPLHGLPISVKDSFHISGVQTTIGYVSFLDHLVPTENSILIDILLRLGAVLYVKTNVPQTLMTADSENNIFGRTRNPRKLNLTAGGSSGGEGALVAFRGSVLGVGTDIAGSIRIPSLCCGTYGFKPTADRIPFGRQATPALHGIPGIAPAAGPLATSISDLGLFFRSVLRAKPWQEDSTAIALPYQPADNDSYYETSLTIGILPEDPQLPLHPPVRSALDSAIRALTAAGHKIVPLPLRDVTSVVKAGGLSLRFFAIDEKNTGIQHILDSGEPMIATVAAAVKPEVPDRPNCSISELAAMNAERGKFQEGWRKLFAEYNLDVVICPGAQHTAPKHDTYGPPMYTLLWNLLDYPACVIPYGKASMTLCPNEAASEAIDNPKYDASAFDGAPTAIQVVAPRFQDEFCLRAADIIDSILSLES